MELGEHLSNLTVDPTRDGNSMILAEDPRTALHWVTFLQSPLSSLRSFSMDAPRLGIATDSMPLGTESVPSVS